MSYNLGLLERWAYIMVILVCFTILVTFFVYILCFLLMLHRKLRSRNRSLENDEIDTETFNFLCCDSTPYETQSTPTIKKTCELVSSIPDYGKDNQIKLNSILIKPLNERIVSDTNTTSVNETIVKTESIDSYMPKLIKNIKNMFSFSDSNEVSSLSNMKTVIIPANARNHLSSDSSSSDEAEKITRVKTTKETAMRKSSFRRGSMAPNTKPRAFRNSSLPNTRAHVKFNPNTKKGSDESDSSISDDYPSSITNKKSISSYQDSRKNSSSSSSYYQSSVVDLYRQQRLASNASLISANNRKFSINHSNPFNESGGVKLITLEQQDKLYDENKQKKLSLHSIFNTQSGVISKLDVLNMRRYSMATSPVTDVSEKFWVPADIIAQKQRSSLPTTSTLTKNDQVRLNFIHKTNHFTNEDSKLLNEKKFLMDSAYMSQISNIDQAQTNTSFNNNNTNLSNTSPPPPPLPTSSTKLAGRRRASMFDPIDPTELQKTLYSNVNNSNNYASKHNSTSSDHSSGENSIGTIEFAVQYINDCQRLIVEVLRIFDMSVSTRQDAEPSTVDIFCKCVLMPDKFSYSTKPVKMCSNPVFEEQFEFRFLESTHLESCFLEISLVEVDKQSKEEYCIGTTVFRLNYSNIETRKIFLKDFKILTKSNEDNYMGEIMFSLAYLTAAERLTIIVMKARNLTGIGNDKKTLPDPCVKVSLIGKDGKKLKKKRTSTQKSTLNPVYNEEIVFANLKRDQLDDIFIHFSVYHDSLTSRETLGNFMISSSCRGNDYIQWKNMIDGKKSIAWWHNLCSPNTLDKILTNNNNRVNSTRIKSINFSSLKIRS